jgi:hypothetical protein
MKIYNISKQIHRYRNLASKSLATITLLGYVLVGIAGSATEPADRLSTPPASRTSGAATDVRYADFLARVRAYNSEYPELDSWSMNCEHCLVADADLVEDVIRFVREPGVIDFIFGRLLDGNCDDGEVLADAELLVYAGEYQVNNAEVIPGGRRAAELLSAAENGRFSRTESVFPQAPIRQKIEIAAQRALKNRQPTTRSESEKP